MLKKFILTLLAIQLAIAEVVVEEVEHLEERQNFEDVDDFYADEQIYRFAAADGITYTIEFSRSNWFGALQRCAARNASLASIETEQENKNILNYLFSRGLTYTTRSFWLSATDLASTPGNFIWSNTGNIISYQNWARGEPNNSGGNERCVAFTSTGTWNDLNCNTQLYFICQQASSTDDEGAPDTEDDGDGQN